MCSSDLCAPGQAWPRSTRSTVALRWPPKWLTSWPPLTLLSPSEIVVALLEHLKEALDVKLVLTIEEPATPVNKSVTATESGLSNMDDKNDGETEVAPPVPRNRIKDRLSVKKGKAA